MDSPIETFMITFDEIKDNSAVLIMGWSTTIAALPIAVSYTHLTLPTKRIV